MLEGMQASGYLNFQVENAVESGDQVTTSSKVVDLGTPLAADVAAIHTTFSGNVGRAQLDLGTLAAHHLNTVVQAKAAGVGGNSITVAAVGDGAQATKASLDLSTKGNAQLDTVVQARATGTGGNAITVELLGDNNPGAGVTISEVSNAVTIHYEDGTSTVADVEASIAANSTKIEVKTAGTPDTTLTSDTFSATNLAGGTNAAAVSIAEAGTAVTIHYTSGVSTVANVETAITASSTLIKVLTAGTGATVLSNSTDNFTAHALAGGVDGVAVPGSFTNPDVPRNATVTYAAGWDGGDITIHGVGQFDEPLSETFTAATGTVVGSKIFAAVTSADRTSVGSNSAQAKIGVGNTLGALVVLKDATFLLFAGATLELTATADLDNNALIPATVPDGSLAYKAVVNT